MAITRTAKGTVSDKSSGLTLTITSIVVPPNGKLFGFLGYDLGNGAPVVKYGPHLLKSRQTNTGNGVAAKIVSWKNRTGRTLTKNLVATWTTSAPTAKAMCATLVENIGKRDVKTGNSQASTSNPNTGTQQTTIEEDEIWFGIFAGEGPSSDSISADGSWNKGQEIGTAGAPPASNVTLTELYQIVTATSSTAQASLTNSTASRDYSSCFMALHNADTYLQHGISPSDAMLVQDKFEAGGLNSDDVVYWWNDEESRYEAYEVDAAARGALVAHEGDKWA